MLGQHGVLPAGYRRYYGDAYYYEFYDSALRYYAPRSDIRHRHKHTLMRPFLNGYHRLGQRIAANIDIGMASSARTLETIHRMWAHGGDGFVGGLPSLYRCGFPEALFGVSRRSR
jgi:hypothetical protein